MGNWLYGVARNTARKAGPYARRREREATAVTRREAREELEHEVRTLLDDELSRLPDRYRTPIVLCDLEGRTIAEAAAHLLAGHGGDAPAPRPAPAGAAAVRARDRAAGGCGRGAVEAARTSAGVPLRWPPPR